MTFNSTEAIVAAGAAGLGVIQVAEYYARPSLDTGQLVEILADYKADGHIVSVVFPKQRSSVRATRVFVDFLIALFDRTPWNDDSLTGSVAGGSQERLRQIINS
jgi:LysR family transcriptional regulator for bpeEF and oprC